jgi:hypothetical protein
MPESKRGLAVDVLGLVIAVTVLAASAHSLGVLAEPEPGLFTQRRP